MPRPLPFILCSFLTVSSLGVVHAQEAPPTPARGIGDLKTVVVATDTKSDSVIAVPPMRSATFTFKRENEKEGAEDARLSGWLSKQKTVNGLESPDLLLPWHVVVTYDQFDEDGDNVHSGVYEEYWVGPKKYKRSYKSDNFNQTDYATDKGLYRYGDQAWPSRAQLQIRAEVVDPFSYAGTLQGYHERSVERSFSGYTLRCTLIEGNSGISDPTQYCFEPDRPILRYSHGDGWFQTVYNQILPFQGRNLAREVDVTDGGKPYLKLRVERAELISKVDDAAFIPPRDAVALVSERIAGVTVTPVNMSSMAQWPVSLRSQHFIVRLEIVIGKNGHVISARGVSGPPEGFKACEDAARKWVFKPYLVLGKPVEVEQKVECSNN
jgi:hypothetical protein